MKRIFKNICGLLIAFAFVVTGLKLTGVEAKEVTLYVYETYFRDTTNPPQPKSGSPNLATATSFAAGDQIEVKFTQYIPFAPGTILKLYIYEKNVSTNQLTEKKCVYFNIGGVAANDIQLTYIFDNAYDNINGAQIEYGDISGNNYEVKVIINVKPETSPSSSCHSDSSDTESKTEYVSPEEVEARKVAAEKAKVEQEKKEFEALVKKEESISLDSLEVSVANTSASTSSVAKAIPAEVKNVASEGEKVYNFSSLTTTQGVAKAIDKLATTVNTSSNTASNKTNSTVKNEVTVYSKYPIAFNAAIVKSLNNLNADFVYMFNYKGKLYKITIPAGAEVNLNGQTFHGPLFLASLYGTIEVLK